MSMDIILQSVSSIGFPIAAFFLLFWLVKEDINKLTEAVNNNTKSTDILITLMKEERLKNNDD